MFFRSKKIIGLDIGTSTIKIAEIDVGGRSPKLISFGLVPTPSNAIVGGEIVEPDLVSAAISGLIQETKIKCKHICTGMWGTAVIVKRISIPKMEKSLINDQIRWEAEQYIPFDINDISLGYHILKNHSKKSEMMEILLVAAKQDLVLKYAQVVTGAGLECSIVDVSGFALANAFELSYGVFPNQTVALLNIGSGVTNFVIVENGEVVFCRDIPVGGRNYSNEIQKEMNISFDEAEAFKIAASHHQEIPDEVMSIMSATNENVVEEIKNSFDFYSATANGSPVNHCFYTGGGSYSLGLISSLSTAVSLQLTEMDPLKNIQVNSKVFNKSYLSEIKPFCAVVLGLGSRKMGDQ